MIYTTTTPERAADWRCPDCNSITIYWCDDGAITTYLVMHDDTCPTYVAMTNGEAER